MSDNETCLTGRESDMQGVVNGAMGFDNREPEMDDTTEDYEIDRWEQTETHSMKVFIHHLQMFQRMLYDERINLSVSDEIRLFHIYISNRS
jgi:hypothetical protein